MFGEDFENGVVIFEFHQAKKTINLGGEYEKINGNQDKSVNDGLFVSEITLEPYDGIILLSRLGEIKGAFYSNGSFVRVFNGSGNLSRSGFFAYKKAFRGGINLLEKSFEEQKRFYISNEKEVREFMTALEFCY